MPPVVCIQSSWAREQLAALEAEAAEEGAAAQYSLNFLYLAKNIAVSVDQVFKAVRRGNRTVFGRLVFLSLPLQTLQTQHDAQRFCTMMAGTAQPADRVLLLAAKRCLGGAQDVP